MALLAMAFALDASAHLLPGSMAVRWNDRVPDCGSVSPPPLQVHAYERRTWILRQHRCAHFQTRFLYLLVGSERALLIGAADAADPVGMTLAATVLGLLAEQDAPDLSLVISPTHRQHDRPADGSPPPAAGTGAGAGALSSLPLDGMKASLNRDEWSAAVRRLVTHPGGHQDPPAEDTVFAGLPLPVEILPRSPEGVKAYFGLDDWPRGAAALELGGRTVDVLPAPGRHPADLVFHDRLTGILFTGDFLLPGRLRVEDPRAYRDSAARIVDFVQDRPVTHVLGGRIDLDANGTLYPAGASHRRDERRLELAKEDLLALAEALREFNGFHARHPNFTLSSPRRIHAAIATSLAGALTATLAAAWFVVARSRVTPRRG
jgi:glyoxylase-like metal-dependent hydrolase (beta-lactamase superfamily II)